MSGGFNPQLRREPTDGFEYEPEFMASDNYIMKRGGITVAASTVGADANGDKILKKGTVMALIEASGDDQGKYRAYLNNLDANAGGVANGFLPETINLRDGDVICGLFVEGAVVSARCSGLDSDARTDLAGRIVFQ